MLDAFEAERIVLTLAVVSMNLAVTFEGLIMTTGRTRVVLIAGLLGSWAGQVPARLITAPPHDMPRYPSHPSRRIA